MEMQRKIASRRLTWTFSSPDVLFADTASTSDIFAGLNTVEINIKAQHALTSKIPVVVYTVQMAASVGHVLWPERWKGGTARAKFKMQRLCCRYLKSVVGVMQTFRSKSQQTNTSIVLATINKTTVEMRFYHAYLSHNIKQCAWIRNRINTTINF